MADRPRVAVIILTHAGDARTYLEACHQSLTRQTYPAERFRVFIVGNGVSPEVSAWIARLAPDARLLENPANLGCSGGNNRAIAVAMTEGAEYLVMLNIDTVVDRDWLQALVDAADARSDSHILQSTILLDRTEKIQSLGNRIQYLGYGYCNGYGHARSNPPQGLPMDYASGAAMLVKRAVFEAIGLFREDYFMYHDDLEFCWRARLAGFNVGLVEQSVCHHKYEFQARLPMLYYFQRNRLLTLFTLERLGTIVVTAPCLIVSEVVLGIYFIARGWGATVWRVLRYFLRAETWVRIASHRRQIRLLRVRKDADIVRRFAGTVVFSEVENPALRYVLNPLLRLYWACAKVFIVW